MKRNKILLFFVILFVAACEPNDDEHRVTYRISDNESGFSVSYRDEQGDIQRKSVDVSSAEDIWTYAFTGTEGDIVYVSANYKDPETGINVEILLNGKVFLQESSLYDTLNFVTVSGSIPYE